MLRRLIPGVLVVVLAGCGGDRHVTVLSPPFLSPSALERYPAGSASRAAAGFLLALEYNDPVGARSYLLPAWRVTPTFLTPILPRTELRLKATAVNPARADVVLPTRSTPVTLEFVRTSGGWQVARIRLPYAVLSPSNTRPSHTRARPTRTDRTRAR